MPVYLIGLLDCFYEALLLEVIHSTAEHAGVPGKLHVLVQHFAGTLCMAHAAEHAAVGAGDAFDGLHAAVGAEQDVHAGLAFQIHILGGDLAVCLHLGDHFLAGNEAAFAVADGEGVNVVHV